jgi:hypothetical protein
MDKFAAIWKKAIFSADVIRDLPQFLHAKSGTANPPDHDHFHALSKLRLAIKRYTLVLLAADNVVK